MESENAPIEKPRVGLLVRIVAGGIGWQSTLSIWAGRLSRRFERLAASGGSGVAGTELRRGALRRVRRWGRVGWAAVAPGTGKCEIWPKKPSEPQKAELRKKEAFHVVTAEARRRK